MKKKRKEQSKALWGGRFSKGLDPIAKSFSYSLAVDKRLLPYDIETSIAHVKTLAKAKVLKKSEAESILKGLKSVLSQLSKEDLTKYEATVEDVHTLVQNKLEAKIGALAKKLHTARSRNDQVVTATKLYLRDVCVKLIKKVSLYQKALLKLAEQGQDVAIPGYTHLQRAQTVLFAHHVLAYIEMAERDKKRISDALGRMDELPLGCGALAGLSFNLDRAYTAKLLGFSKVSTNSLDTVSSRDFCLEVLSVLSIMYTHFSRLAEDFILWSSQEFSFIEISDDFATGSSIMPHKKNADMFELTRGRAGKIYGNLVHALSMLKGLPLSYNRDMQEDKETLFVSCALAEETLSVLSTMIQGIKIRKERCLIAAYDSFLYATDMMDYLVHKGVALKDAHTIVGRVVQFALNKHKDLSKLKVEELKKFSSFFEKDVAAVFDPMHSLRQRKTVGSTNPTRVRNMITTWKKKLS